MSRPFHPVEQALRRHAATGPWLVCVSGGADSMALLRGAVAAGIPLRAAHCNFSLRGEESDRDQAFVERACAGLDVPLSLTRFDTMAYCRERGVSLEMGCRSLRYDWFRQLKKEYELARIAVAHNADDADETMLLNLLRGTGIDGLTGMAADTGEILRPLLHFPRASLEDYLHSIGQEWVTDSSNLQNDYKRNFLRNEILPALRTRWPGLQKTLARTRAHLAQTRILAQAELSRTSGVTPGFLPLSALRECPSPGALVHLWLKNKGATPSQVDEMAAASPGAHWTLPEGEVSRSGRGLHYEPHGASTTLPSIKIEKLKTSEAVLASMRSESSQNAFYCPSPEGLHMRPSRPDDRIRPFGMKGSMAVTKVLKEAGLPPARRTGFPLLVDSRDRVLWLPGIKRSALLAVSHGEQTIYRITLT